MCSLTIARFLSTSHVSGSSLIPIENGKNFVAVIIIGTGIIGDWFHFNVVLFRFETGE